MNETPKDNRGWRILRRILLGLAIFATLVAIFYTEEDWRGKRAWEKCKTDLEVKGMVLDWSKYIPPPVPDGQNFFMASTNIFLRFVKAQTPAQADAAAQLKWLPLAPTGSNSFPVFETAKSKPLVVAELIVLTPEAFIVESAKTNLILKLDSPATQTELGNLIQHTVGRSANGSQGFEFSEFQLSNIAPAQIILQADSLPSINDLENLIPPDTATNIGHLRVEATSDKKVFQVSLTGVSITAAADYLKWSDQFVPALDEVREALKRPYAIIPGDYSQPFPMPTPNFVTMRFVAQTLAQRTQCYLLLGQRDKALREVTLMHDLCRILERPPTGRPITLVEAMINVAITGLYVNTIADGFRLHAWQEPQMAVLQEQLKAVSLPPSVVAAINVERSASIHIIEPPTSKIRDAFRKADAVYGTDFFTKLIDPLYLFLKLAPRGWIYQNMVNVARLELKSLDGFDLGRDTISPRIFDETDYNRRKLLAHRSPFNIYAAILVPNTVKATQVLAYNQTQVNEAQIVCALERYRLARGEYPESLDALVPQFIEKLPHDIIGGAPLHYRQIADGKYLFYSVGWNETDDGGEPSPPVKVGPIDYTKGDWVWKN